MGVEFYIHVAPLFNLVHMLSVFIPTHVGKHTNPANVRYPYVYGF